MGLGSTFASLRQMRLRRGLIGRRKGKGVLGSRRGKHGNWDGFFDGVVKMRRNRRNGVVRGGDKLQVVVMRVSGGERRRRCSPSV